MKLLNVGLIASLLFLIACDPVSLTVGSVVLVGTTAVRNENGVIGSISDGALQTSIYNKLLSTDKDLLDRVELVVKHGMVIVIGYMDDKSQCERAIQVIKGVSGWKDVFDETKIQERPNASVFAKDSVITSRINTAITFDGNVSSLNYSITTVNGIVYICGTAQSKYERDIVLNHARSTSGVDKVVAYIKISNKGT